MGSRDDDARDAATGIDPALREEAASHVDRASLCGARIGGYVVRELLAMGGFGTVYRAEHEALGELRALKILHAELASSPSAVLRFEREIEVIRRISHPGVVAIHDVGQLDDGRPYFAMELLPGVDLGAHVRAVGRLSIDEALSILEPVADALDAVHAMGIIHRDVKPSNVFLSTRDGALRVVLLDFGLAKLLDDCGPGLTGSRQVIGTPAFMAPEQIRAQPVDVRTDVYALGAMSYYLVTGERPFGSGAQVLAMQLHTRPARPSARAPIDPALDDVLLRALSKDPAHRQRSAGELLAELGRASGARPPAPSDRAGSRAVGLHIEVRADGDAMEDPDERLLGDLDTIFPESGSLLASAGFRAALSTGNTALFLLDLPADPVEGRAAGRRAVDAAIALHEALARRAGRDPRVRVILCLHAGAVRSGATAGGELMDLAAWVPDFVAEGVLCTRALAAELDLAAAPVLESAAFARVIERCAG